MLPRVRSTSRLNPVSAYLIFDLFTQVQSSKFKVEGSKFKVEGSKFKVQSSRLGLPDLDEPEPKSFPFCSRLQNLGTNR
jgi:hypothetical protein